MLSSLYLCTVRVPGMLLESVASLKLARLTEQVSVHIRFVVYYLKLQYYLLVLYLEFPEPYSKMHVRWFLI